MEINNDLRRTKLKLKMLEETEGLNWLLFDLIKQEVQKESSYVPDDEDCLEIVEELKKGYKEYIKDHSPKDKKQAKLF